VLPTRSPGPIGEMLYVFNDPGAVRRESQGTALAVGGRRTGGVDGVQAIFLTEEM
jgi:hypothetical protein